MDTMQLDPHAVADILRETAAEEILPRFRQLAHEDVREKSPGDLVTIADESAERVLEQRLGDLRPGALVLGEEAAARDEAVLDYLKSAEDVWIVDPVDGTGNFAAGRPVFAVMVALVRRGETLAAWIYLPVTGEMVIAEHGGGAWLGDRRLQAAKAESDLSSMSGTLHYNQFGRREIARQIEARRGRLQTLKSLRCAGAEYVRLVKAESHFSLFTKLAPWDHAPGTLIYTEAGGLARLLNGEVYTPGGARGDGLLLGPDETSWRGLYETLFGV